ncbi:MAG: flagellar capping protein [Lachnospiraceae bacterium]|nr:flagellar capping protein [Lachnospiraceae bacterium]
MAFNAVQSNIYNYYLTTYSPKSVTKYDAHKKSELRSLYNSMVKLNKESPLYLIPNAKESARFAVDIKENARELGNQIASLGGLDDTPLLNKKTAYSSRSDLVSVEYIGDLSDLQSDSEAPVLELEIQALADNQINLGKYLPGDEEISLPEDTYSFDIGINGMNYEFQFNIHSGETNRNIQDRLARLFNNSNIGLNVNVVEGENGTSALKIVSEETGLRDGEASTFTVSDDNTSKTSGVVSYLGLDYIMRNASNAQFTINGEAHEAHSNNFTIGKLYEVHLRGVSTEETGAVSIGLKQDYEAVQDNISELAGNYNHFLQAVNSYKDAHSSSQKLYSEITGIASNYKDQLHSIGLDIQDNGQLAINKDTLSATAMSDDAEAQLGVVKDLTRRLYHKTRQISLNPMNYVDKHVVAYKNPGRNFVSPYVTSNYSGMMFNYYC